MLANLIGWKPTSKVMVSWTKSAGAVTNHGAIKTAVRAPVAIARAAPKGRQHSSRGRTRAKCCLLAQASARGMIAHQDRPERTNTAHQTSAVSNSGSVQAWSTWVKVPGGTKIRQTAAAVAHRASAAPVAASSRVRRSGRAPPARDRTERSVAPMRVGRPTGRESCQMPAASTTDQISSIQRTSPKNHRPGARSTVLHGR